MCMAFSNRCDRIDSIGNYTFVNKIDAMASINANDDFLRVKSMRSHRFHTAATYSNLGAAAISASV
jgi:hypothetical protein